MARVCASPITFSAALGSALLLTLLGWSWKIANWRRNDALVIDTNVNTATGLPGGQVHVLEWPHSEENYLLKEMGFRIARKHAAKLRRIAIALGFGLPLLLSCIPLVASGWPATVAMLLAVASAMTGILAERWLFFAEARHVVTLYYGRAA